MKQLIPVNELGRPLVVGDTVMIRDDIRYGEFYGRFDGGIMGTSRAMERYKALVAKIGGCSSEGAFYRIDLDCGEWKWVDGMFSGVYVDIEDLGDIETADDLSMTSLFGGVKSCLSFQ